MIVPEPKPGLVLRYAYLWRREAWQGKDEAAKDRPCVVVLAVRRDGSRTRVVVAPITHAPLRDPTDGVALPIPVKRRLGLDDESSWVVTTEVNAFDWPGPDLRPAGRGSDGVAYGFLPTSLARTVIEAVRRSATADPASVIPRDDPSPR